HRGKVVALRNGSNRHPRAGNRLAGGGVNQGAADLKITRNGTALRRFSYRKSGDQQENPTALPKDVSPPHGSPRLPRWHFRLAGWLRWRLWVRIWLRTRNRHN